MKKGFTLIELLAVIVILAVMAIIAVPIVLNVIEKARLGSAESSVFGYIDAVEKQTTLNLASKDLEDIKDGTYTVEELENLGVSVNGKGPSSGFVVITDHQIEEATLCINDYKTEYKNNKLTTKKEKDCVVGIYHESILNSSIPLLETGMIPVTIDTNGVVKKANLYSKWYSYEKKEWANAVLVTNTSKSTYDNSIDGTVIAESDILAYFVWIPRYEYKISGTNPSEIKINFLEKTQTTATTNYIIHSAFTFGAKELSGIWVAKFETTGTSSLPTIKPNLSSLRDQNISSEFKTAELFESNSIYGITNNDAHMMKKTEWGSVAYLSHSKYGINKEVRINNNNGYITGCGASTENGTSTSECEIKYGTVTNYPQSTTGNITGIFDMSGGAAEQLMGVQYNDSTNTNLTVASSGFTEIELNAIDSKYINKYAYGTTNNDENAYNRSILGDATKETKWWYGDNGYFVSTDGPWVFIGGYHGDDSRAGIFSFSVSHGHGRSDATFRLVLAEK